MISARNALTQLKAVFSPSRLLIAAGVIHIAFAAVVAPVTSHPYDLAVLTSNAQAWLRWGFSPLYQWKFGLDYAGLAILSQLLRAALEVVGVPGVAALHIAWKLPLVGADVLNAGLIYRLALRMAPRRAAALAIIWLVSPVPLWVSAGHGQVEALAVCCLLAALELSFSGRFVLAGIVTGLGVGIEYFPVAAAAAVFIWSLGGHVSWRSAAGYGAGLFGALGACFGPLALDFVWRTSLYNGLASSGALTPGSIYSPLSAWSWVGYQGAEAWPALFVALCLFGFAVAARFASRGTTVAISFVGAMLVIAVLVDANTLPQFALVALAAISLLSLTSTIHPFFLVLVPTSGLATYFFYLDQGASTANAFFYDVWYASDATALWDVPRSELLARFLGMTFSVGLFACLATATYRLRVGYTAWRIAAVACALLSGLVIVWVMQPSLWRDVSSSALTANLPDFDYAANNRPGTVLDVSADTYQIRYPEQLLSAARSSRIRPSGALRVRAPDLYALTGVGAPRTTRDWGDVTIAIPDWDTELAKHDNMWVQLLVGSKGWSGERPPSRAELTLDVGQTAYTPNSIDIVAPAQSPRDNGWAVVTYLFPSAAIRATGAMELRPASDTVLWNGSATGPWVRVTPASGETRIALDNMSLSAPYAINPNGDGYIVGLPLSNDYRVTLIQQPNGGFEVVGAVLQWSDGPESWKANALLQLLGTFYGIGAIALVIFIAKAMLCAPEPSMARPPDKERGRITSRPSYEAPHG